MPCVNCQASTNVPPGGLSPDDICRGIYINTDCVLYRGEPLTEIQVETNDSVTTILTTLDTIVGTIIAGSFTADEGLWKNTSTNVQLGEPTLNASPNFTGNRFINTGLFKLSLEGAGLGYGNEVLKINNTGASNVYGIQVNVTGADSKGIRIEGTGNSGGGQSLIGLISQVSGTRSVGGTLNGGQYGLLTGAIDAGGSPGFWDDSAAIWATGTGYSTGLKVGTIDGWGLNIFTSTTNYYVTSGIDVAIRISKPNLTTSGQGSEIIFDLNSARGPSGSFPYIPNTSLRSVVKSFASNTSEFQIWGRNGALVNNKISTIEGDGKFILHKYGIGTFTGTPEYNLGVTSTGTVIETLAIIPFRQTLSALQCLTLYTVPVDIADLPVPGAGFAWEIITMSVSCILNTTDYDFNDIQIIADTALTNQFSYNYGATTSATSNIISRGTEVNANNSGFRATVIDNKKMKIQTEIDPTVGDGTFVVYGTARKITL